MRCVFGLKQRILSQSFLFDIWIIVYISKMISTVDPKYNVPGLDGTFYN